MALKTSTAKRARREFCVTLDHSLDLVDHDPDVFDASWRDLSVEEQNRKRHAAFKAYLEKEGLLDYFDVITPMSLSGRDIEKSHRAFCYSDDDEFLPSTLVERAWKCLSEGAARRKTERTTLVAIPRTRELTPKSWEGSLRNIQDDRKNDLQLFRDLCVGSTGAEPGNFLEITAAGQLGWVHAEFITHITDRTLLDDLSNMAGLLYVYAKRGVFKATPQTRDCNFVVSKMGGEPKGFRISNGEEYDLHLCYWTTTQ